MRTAAIALAVILPLAASHGATDIATPADIPYPGKIRLDVDARDVQRRIVHVEEHLTGAGPGTVLLLPRWVPGNHAPSGPIDRFTGLKIQANGVPVAWSRDAVDIYAFHVAVASAGTTLDIRFDYLSPLQSTVDYLEITPDLAILDWHPLVLYPAGYFARQVPVSGTLRLPSGWQFATALEPDAAAAPGAAGAGPALQFREVSLERLIDSPVYAGRYASRVDLDPGAAAPVRLDLFADRPEQLAAKPEQLEAYRRLVQQARWLFASHHYAHYDFMYALSDQLPGNGVEHHQSSEDTDAADMFTDWDNNAGTRDLLAHEYTHSWNGKFRRPADLWTPNYNVPMQNSLLWVYEGQTEYWGNVLAARAGLRSRQQALDDLALFAATYSAQAGRQWRSLQDTTSQPIINFNRPHEWNDWSRGTDYYDEGLLIWLDVDTLIRERSRGKRSLDDFAQRFFGIRDGQFEVVTYTFDDVVAALDAVEHYDWATFLRTRLDAVAAPAPLEGLTRGGYRLVFTDKPSEFEKNLDAKAKVANFIWSIGLTIGSKDGNITECAWGGPAFQAGITEAGQVLAVNGLAYEPEILEDAIRAATENHQPIRLIVKTGNQFRVADVDYTGGLRYPHLERDTAHPALLDQILAPRTR